MRKHLSDMLLKDRFIGCILGGAVGDGMGYAVEGLAPLELEQYKARADREAKLIFGGRLGGYKYYDMDKVIAAALQLCEVELK